jgi:hypothetical protein
MMYSELIWLTFGAGSASLLLQEHYQTYNLFDDLSLDEQKLQMIVFIGSQTKTQVLRKTRFGSRTQEISSGEVQLRLDLDTITDPEPVFYTDCELHNRTLLATNASEYSGNIKSRTLLSVMESDPAILAHQVYGKLISSFSTLICLFADDLGDLSGVAKTLARGLTNVREPFSDLPVSTLPKILIFKNTRTEANTGYFERDATKKFLSILSKEVAEIQGGSLGKNGLDVLLGNQFNGVEVLGLPVLTSSQQAWTPLRERLLRESGAIQELRNNHQVAFSIRHFKAFFHLAIDHFCTKSDSQFSFIEASRASNPLSKDYSVHLTHFLRNIERKQILNFAVPVIASVLVFDSYPPGMHSTGISKS